MIRLEQDLDDLDRMVENGAPKDAIRSQIRLIAREVTALEANYAGLAEAHQQLTAENRRLIQSQSRPPLNWPQQPPNPGLPGAQC